ncbi:hypothetical protein G3M81_12385 [Bacillus paralicheniformis]|uniref:hypothetical protein n=1 Tax=Bacillus paralicheniformis TaxID=1648923 RepID=UPI0013EF4E9E|nr:hypothetical protein [Bacillus paralicheniformis]MEC0752132.1 hypothetical protein [Bacillus haynesii]QII49489.1 hypothetical protein G3M81_12385 [Bacillus paralicheniformis]
MRIEIERIRRLRETDNIFCDGKPILIRSGIGVETIVKFDSGNKATMNFEFPELREMSFAEVEELIRKELLEGVSQ